MEVFNAVVVAGSISKATKHTGLSQPTISQQLAQLEDILGTPLIYRRRSAHLELTPAGEYWLRASDEILTRMDEIETLHREQFLVSQLTLHFGVTPSMRGRFTEAAATIAVSLKKFARFEFVWGLNSDEIVEKIDLHQINCAILSASSVQNRHSSLHVVPLFRDRIAWAVPKSIPADVVFEALETRRVPAPAYEALTRFVDVGATVPWYARTESWYRAHLPFAMPYFNCMTHQAAVDFVAAGLGTCHCPISLLPNLPDQVRDRLQLFDLKADAREAVFVMPKHLLSLRPFADFQEGLCQFVRTEYDENLPASALQPLPDKIERW